MKQRTVLALKSLNKGRQEHTQTWTATKSNESQQETHRLRYQQEIRPSTRVTQQGQRQSQNLNTQS